MAKYPKLDLPPIPDDLDVRLQSRAELERVHDESELASYFYPVAHSAITLKANECIDVPSLVLATDLGVGAFEAIGYHVEPESTYSSQHEQVIAGAAAELFVGRVTQPDLYADALDKALVRMETDTPRLTETLKEVLGSYLDYDPVRLRFALQGAAAIRGMQIFVDRKIERLA
jgi:hypothetical protein